MHIDFLSSSVSAQEGAMDCIFLHSSKSMDSISGVLDISNRNNCKCIIRRAKCSTWRVRTVQETAVWVLQSFSPFSGGIEVSPSGLEVKRKHGRVRTRGGNKRYNQQNSEQPFIYTWDESQRWFVVFILENAICAKLCLIMQIQTQIHEQARFMFVRKRAIEMAR